MQKSSLNLDRPARRDFLKQSSAIMASGLAVGFFWRSAKAQSAAATTAADAAPFAPNAWVRVLADNTVKIVVHKHDSGTGTQTALAACVAEELDVDPMAVEVITPENPFFEEYIHPIWQVFSTGGSTSVALEYDRLRQAGATARAMLIDAAAQKWDVSPQSCTTQNGVVVHTASGQKADYGALTNAAAQRAAPAKVTLKSDADFKYIGKLKAKRDAAPKTTGEFVYSIDVDLPDLLVAVVTRAPVVNARVKHLDAGKALKMPGVQDVITIPGMPDVLGGNQEGVAILADNYWSAQQARSALDITWTDSEHSDFDSDKLADQQAAWIDSPDAKPVPTIQAGDTAAELASADTVLEAAYTMPYKIAHPLEPLCITAWEQDGHITYWGGVQVPSSAKEAAELICNIPADRVTLNDMVSGGSFGARESKYWLFEVSYLTHKTGKPIKLLNSREDETHALYSHPATYHRLKGAIGAQGALTAFELRAVSPASPEQWEPGYFEREDRMDYSTTETICEWDFAYRAKNMDVAWVPHETGIPSGWYRAVSFIPNVFAVEGFIDELAHAAKQDPLEFRLAHMHERPRHVDVLKMACEKAGWGSDLPEGTSLGIATNQGYNSYIAVVARIRKVKNRIQIEHITCVADCGLAVSPSGVQEQIYGGLVWGVGHALYDHLDIKQGSVVQSNFHDYPVVRNSDMPDIDITIVEGDRSKPSGVGELSNPAVAPAIANAIFRLTGDRQRTTPLNFATS